MSCGRESDPCYGSSSASFPDFHSDSRGVGLDAAPTSPRTSPRHRANASLFTRRYRLGEQREGCSVDPPYVHHHQLRSEGDQFPKRVAAPEREGL